MGLASSPRRGPFTPRAPGSMKKTTGSRIERSKKTEQGSARTCILTFARQPRVRQLLAADSLAPHRKHALMHMGSSRSYIHENRDEEKKEAGGWSIMYRVQAHTHTRTVTGEAKLG